MKWNRALSDIMVDYFENSKRDNDEINLKVEYTKGNLPASNLLIPSKLAKILIKDIWIDFGEIV